LIQLRVSNYIFATHYWNLSGETVATFDLSGIPGGLVMDGLVSIAIVYYSIEVKIAAASEILNL
jgi:hypothetical protein